MDSRGEKSQSTQKSRLFSNLSRSTRCNLKHSKAALISSNQSRRELEIAKLRRDEIERQNEAAIRLKQKANKLKLEIFVKDKQRKLIEARIVAINREELSNLP